MRVADDDDTTFGTKTMEHALQWCIELSAKPKCIITRYGAKIFLAPPYPYETAVFDAADTQLTTTDTQHLPRMPIECEVGTFKLRCTDEERRYINIEDIEQSMPQPGFKLATSDKNGKLVGIFYASDVVFFVDRYGQSLLSPASDLARYYGMMLLVYLKQAGRLVEDHLPSEDNWHMLPLPPQPTFDELEFGLLMYMPSRLAYDGEDDPGWEWTEPGTPS